MTTSNISPVTGSLVLHGDSFSFDLDDGGTTPSVIQVSVEGSATEIAWTLAGGFQSGFTGSSIKVGNVYTIVLRRTAGWDASPFTVNVDWTISGTPSTSSWSYELAVEQQYPTGMTPRNPIAQGTLIITENDAAKLSDAGWIDFVGATVTPLGNGKVRVEVTGGGSGTSFHGFGEWEFDSTTAKADPGDGKFRLNNATQGSATELYLSQQDISGATLDNALNSLQSGDTIRLQSATQAQVQVYTVNGTVVDEGVYKTVPIAHVSAGSSDLVNADKCSLYVLRAVATSAQASIARVTFATGGGTPGTAEVTTNTTNWAAATTIKVHERDLDTNNIMTPWYDRLRVGDHIGLRERFPGGSSTAGNFLIDAISYAANVYTFTVTAYAGNSGTPLGGDIYEVVLGFTKDSGAATGDYGNPMAFFEFDTVDTVATDPGSGKYKADNVSFTAASNFYVSQTDSNGEAMTFPFGALEIGNGFSIHDQAQGWAYFRIIGTPVDNGAWWTFPVDLVCVGNNFAGVSDTDISSFEFLGYGTTSSPRVDTIYVAKHGNDSNDGDTPDGALLTIGAALTAAAALTPAENNVITIKVLDSGVYVENISVTEWITLDARNAEVQGSAAGYALTTSGNTDVYLRVLRSNSGGQTGCHTMTAAATGTARLFIEELLVEASTVLGISNFSTAGGVVFANVRQARAEGSGAIAFGDITSGAGHMHITAGDIYLSGNGSYGIVRVAAGTTVFDVDHILEIGTPTGTTQALYVNTGVLTGSVRTISADTAWNILSAGTLNLFVNETSGTETEVGTANITKAGGSEHGLARRSLGNTTIGVTAAQQFDTDNATPASVTSIRINVLNDLLGFWDSATQTGTLKFASALDPDEYITFDVTAIADVPAYGKDFTVTYRTASAGFAFSGDYSVIWVGDADAGGGGLRSCSFSWTGNAPTVAADYIGASDTDPMNPSWNKSFGSSAGSPTAPSIASLFQHVVPYDGVVTDFTIGRRCNGAATLVADVDLYKVEYTDGSATVTWTKIGTLVQWLGGESTAVVLYDEGAFSSGNTVSKGDVLAILIKITTGVSANHTHRISVSMEET